MLCSSEQLQCWEGCMHMVDSRWYFCIYFPAAWIWNSENEKHFVRGHQFDTRNSLLCKSLIKTEIKVVCTQQDAFAVASQHPLSLPPPEAAAGSWPGLGARRGSTEHSRTPAWMSLLLPQVGGTLQGPTCSIADATGFSKNPASSSQYSCHYYYYYFFAVRLEIQKLIALSHCSIGKLPKRHISDSKATLPLNFKFSLQSKGLFKYIKSFFSVLQ